MQNKIYDKLDHYTKGIYHDKYWKPVHAMLGELQKITEDNGWNFELNNAKYEKDESSNMPIRKIWTIKIDNGKTEKWGHIVAAGAGSVKEPLDAYDVTLAI